MSDPPRWLDLTAAAAHLSLRPDIFARKVKAGIIPEPSTHLGERTPRWDRGALDATMSGGTGSTEPRAASAAGVQKILEKGRARRSVSAERRYASN